MPAKGDVGAPFEVSISSVYPPVLDLSKPTQVVELSGVIKNTSATAFRDVEVYFWRSKDPITTHQKLNDVLGSSPMEPLGRRLYLDLMNFDEISPNRFMEAGEVSTFSVKATIEQLELPHDDAGYLLGAHVRGYPEGGLAKVTIGRSRIPVAATSRLLSIAMVITLSATPTRLTTGDFIDESLLDSLEGELGTMLAAAELSGATLLLDPSVLAEADALAQEHTVKGIQTEGRKVALDWAARTESLLSSGHALRLPYANPSMAQVEAQGNLAQIMNWQTTAVATLRRHSLHSLPLAVDLENSATAENTNQLKQFGIETIFAENVSGEGTKSGSIYASVKTEPTAMGDADDRITDAQRLGRRLAEDLLSVEPRVYVLRSPEDILKLGTLQRNKLVPIPRLGKPFQFAQPEVTTEPREQLAGALAEVRHRAESLEQVTDIAGPVHLSEVLSAVASSGKFEDEASALAYVNAHPAMADTNQVVIGAAEKFVMSTDSNNFPATITNGLPYPVTARLVFDSASPQRIHVPPTDFVVVEPGGKQTFIVSPEASSNGVVSVEASLQTQGGKIFGVPVVIEISATGFGRVGLIIIVIAGAVVLGGSIIRVRQVQAERVTAEPKDSSCGIAPEAP